MQNNSRQYIQSVSIIGILFFIFGFVTWLNGPLITFVKLAFDLDTDSKAFWVTTAFYMAYFFLAVPSSWILEKTGMKKGMALGLLVMAVGTFIFGHFATQRNYSISLLGLFIIGSGLSVLQTACNPYISIIGPIESAAQRISVMGICNKTAGILSPIVLGAFVLKDVSSLEDKVKHAADFAAREQVLNEFASSIYWPYMIMAVILVALAFWITRSPLPEIKASEVNAEPVGKTQRNKTSILQFPYLLLGAFCIFVYVGVEVMAGDAIGTYGKGFNISSDQTKYFTSFTLVAMLAGYVIGLGAIPKLISQQTALKISAWLGIIFTAAALVSHGYWSVGFVAALGLANALMWPAIWPLAIEGLGRFTERGSALLIMGIAGGAIIPKIFATLKDQYDFQWVFFVIMLPCYLYILYFSIKGHRVGKA
ncbi:MAG TPA: sugar MFS transporter [Cyclobacteriaceae bacterium]|nr:sugar MFS transporter [Cyclobacteriaceae bacterium]HMV10095.1 sugar MFS transporter [Cyclobacteriaceae bacterium]HMV88648.1 sugar MFS transporter [Cyclobacteriaceae bacterium]HMX00590.1 sugar MFS transporter [Cyclobacteriaceae bacterium]HMX49535.1 sugar MFS transporter [Cyclobacteriaceae bacterium]